MNIKSSNTFTKLMVLAIALFALNACSSEPSPWTKKDTPWDRRADNAQGPDSEQYKSELEMQGEESPMQLDDTQETVSEEYVVEEEPVQPESASTAGSIMDVPAGYYTVQLMASVDVDRVYRFADKHQLSTQYVVPTLRDGLTWHVLLLDVYPDYASAVAGRNEIAGLLNTQPWVRKVGSVQKLMQ